MNRFKSWGTQKSMQVSRKGDGEHPSLTWTTLLLPTCHWPWWYFTVEPKIKPSDFSLVCHPRSQWNQTQFHGHRCWDCAAKKRGILLHVSARHNNPLWVPSCLGSLGGRRASSLQMLKTDVGREITAADWEFADYQFVIKHQSVPFISCIRSWLFCDSQHPSVLGNRKILTFCICCSIYTASQPFGQTSWIKTLWSPSSGKAAVRSRNHRQLPQWQLRPNGNATQSGRRWFIFRGGNQSRWLVQKCEVQIIPGL